MTQPHVIVKNNFQDAWIDILVMLENNHWEKHNVIVQIKNPEIVNEELHKQYKNFCKQIKIKTPKDVAYTIFPHTLAKRYPEPTQLFQTYNKKVIPKLKKKPHFGWGTYFQRMTDYNGDGSINQLHNIINAINTRERNSKAAFTIIIQKPGGETIRPLGGPCLNYIAVQISKNRNHECELSLLCIYRNHDFLERAYGNYWGLLNLMRFMANETGLGIGSLTCISSHAYVDKKKTELRRFMEEIL